jgi:hypothetical protein
MTDDDIKRGCENRFQQGFPRVQTLSPAGVPWPYLCHPNLAATLAVKTAPAECSVWARCKVGTKYVWVCKKRGISDVQNKA